jgi:ATP-dependent exoDNAse (exonuclease V) beta subunit
MNLSEYRAHKSVNFSTLKSILKSPAHYQAALADDDQEEKEHLILGTLVHEFLLEGKDSRGAYAIKPEGMSFATKEGKAWKAEQTKPILSSDAEKKIPMMADAVLENAHAKAMLTACQHRETPILASIRGVECKGLIDAAGTDGVDWVILDLKTTDDASPEAFARKVANYHYDMQAALYKQLLATHHQIETEPAFYWLVVEKTAPYTCAVYDSSDWITSGEDKLERALETLKECRKSNFWPKPFSGINLLIRPSWA